MPSVTTSLPEITLYSRPGCHLCEQAHETLDAILAERAAAGLPVPAVVVRNIDEDDDLLRRYKVTIPVIAVAGSELELATSGAKIRRLLAESLDGATA
jgi:glutaredoxin